MQKSNFLKVFFISQIKKDKRDREFVTVKFSPAIFLPNGEHVFSNQSPKTRNLWGEFEDITGNKFAADPLFLFIKEGLIKIGSVVSGQIINFQTTQYELNGKLVSSFSTVVFEGEDLIKTANKLLKINKACVINEYGEVTEPQNLENGILVG